MEEKKQENLETKQSEMSHAPVDDPQLQKLESGILKSLDTLNNLANLTTTFTYDSQDLIFSSLNEFVNDLATVDAASKDVKHEIGYEILDAIDRGKNPQLVIFKSLEEIETASNRFQGMLKSMESFVYQLEENLKEHN